ncbi:MAG: hypothetical protein KKI09_00395, partial [Spirochaetes bacterium]|nr:hypothetical protein [Spirochaetota bacterium]
MTGFIVSLGLQVVFCIGVLIWLRYKTKTFFSSTSTVDGVRQEVNSLLIELDASAERNINILEDRIQQLKVQIADADRRITLLGQENRKHQNEAIIYNRSGRMQTVPGDNASIIAGQNTQGAAATAAPAYTYGSQAAVQAVQSQSLAAQEPYLPVSPAAN